VTHTGRIRLVLVDDQVLFVESLKTVLEVRAEDMEVSGVAHNGQEAIEVIRDTRPDIVLMDVRMPGMDGVEAARIIDEQFPGIKVMMLTTFDDDIYVEEAMKYNAVGYMLKNLPPQDLIDSIRAVHNGTIQISPSIMKKILKSGEGKEINDGSTVSVKDFSRREREVLYLISKGYNNFQIAGHLFIAEQTVKNHIAKIYSKIGVHDRFNAAEIGKSLHIGSYCQYLDD